MLSTLSPHSRAVLQAIFVTFLWSTSWVLIKIGLQDDIPPLTYAGLRYTLAFLCLLPLAVRKPQTMTALRGMTLGGWIRLFVLGFLFYAVTQGAQFIGLANLPAINVNLLLSLQAIVVTLMGFLMLRERPTGVQWIGGAFYLLGVLVFFYPIVLPQGQVAAMVVVIAGVLAGSASTVLTRWISLRNELSPLAITLVSMGVGSALLLGIGIATHGLPTLSLKSWLLIAWLAVVNTAFAFTLWNHTLRTLSAMESSIVNNLMMIQIPILAWLFLGEGISLKSGIGFALAGVGILIVQLRRVPKQIKGVIAEKQRNRETEPMV